MLINENIAKKIGLSDKETLIYELLLNEGETTAGVLIEKSGQKRATVYTVLESLSKKGLVEQTELAPVIKYQAKHPYVLKELAESQVREIQSVEGELEALLPNLANLYSQKYNRPGIKFYAGKEGIIKIYEELLRQGKNIDSIEDKGEMAAYIPEYSREYPKKRVKHGIFNRVIAPADNPINPTSGKDMRETRFIPTGELPFRMDIKIADNLISLITFQKKDAVGVLINNQEIAENFKMLFEYFWRQLANKSKATPPAENF